jgi:predicted nucleic acid-binding protein
LDATVFLSAITVLELELGVPRVERRDPGQGAGPRRWLEGQVVREFADGILPVDADGAHRCAGLHDPDPRGERDGLIAATALVHGLAVATRTVDDLLPTGVAIVNPYKTASNVPSPFETLRGRWPDMTARSPMTGRTP